MSEFTLRRADFTLHRGDTRPITGVLEDAAGPVDLSGYDEVRFLMWTYPDLDPVIDELATIVDAAAGEVQYDWRPPDETLPTPFAGDTATPGQYRAVFRALVDAPTPIQVSFPSDRFLVVEILP